MQTITQRREDDYFVTCTEEEDVLDEVLDMERNSEWIPDIISKNLSLDSIDGPIEAGEIARQYNVDGDLARSMSESDGLRLVLIGDTAGNYLLRDTAKDTLYETAKLSGSALGRMSPWFLKETLNNGLRYARGTSLLLVRYDKASALHSNGTYIIMPISELLNISKKELTSSFGQTNFKTGYNSHGYTRALWDLPDARDDFLRRYQDALSGSVSHHYAPNFMPAVRFSSSDTAASAAFLTPCFHGPNNVYLPLGDGLRVEHKNGALKGVEGFEKGAKEMACLFKDSTEAIRNLAHIVIENGCNCVVKLCARYGIPKKYGEPVRAQIETFTAGGSWISAHDLYLTMSLAISAAKEQNASRTVIRNLEDSIAKIIHADWREHDLGGVVAW